MPLGQLTQGASSFADDLVLVATTQEMAKKYLEVLHNWCERNFFDVNARKSGIVRVADTIRTDVPNIFLNESRLHLLNEQDPESDKTILTDSST